MKKGWEYRKLENCLVKVPKQKELKTKDYKTFGQYPIVSQESTLISGYSDDIDKVFSHVKPVIIFGDHTKNVKYIDFDFVVGADGVKILMPQDDIISKFFYYVIKSFRLDNLGYARHYRLLKENIVPVPPLSEQKRIVSYLDSAFAKIDAVAKNAEDSLNEAKALFQSALAKMMEPKEGWEEKHLDELAENLDNKRIPVKLDKRKEGQYPYYGASGIVDYVEDYIFDGNYLLVSEDGANLFARTTPIAFSVSGKFWVNNHAHILKFDNGFTQQFVEYYFKSINIKEYITGAAQPKLTQRNLNKIPIYIPSIKEQQLVVGDLKKLENIIQQLQSNLTHTLSECAALKQSILRQTFE
jgi:type I restriction enzyme S subunit